MTGRTCHCLLLLALPLVGLLSGAARPPVARSSVNRSSQAPKVQAATTAAPDAFQREVTPLVRQYCVGCHGSSSPAAGVSLVGYRDTASMLKDRSVWENVARKVGTGQMPPPGSPQPSRAQR